MSDKKSNQEPPAYFEDVHPENWQFKLPVKMPEGVDLVRIDIKDSAGKLCIFKTAQCVAPFGMQNDIFERAGAAAKEDGGVVKKMTKQKIDLNVGLASVAAGQLVDEAVCSFILKNSVFLFGKQLEKRDVESSGSPAVSEIKVEGQKNRIRVKALLNGGTKFYDADLNAISGKDVDIVKRAKVIATFVPQLWVNTSNHKFGITFNANGIMFFPPEDETVSIDVSVFAGVKTEDMTGTGVKRPLSLPSDFEETKKVARTE